MSGESALRRECTIRERGSAWRVNRTVPASWRKEVIVPSKDLVS